MNGAASLGALADAVGLSVDWTDVAGRPQRVHDDALVVLLEALGVPSANPAQRREAMMALRSAGHLPVLRTTLAGKRVEAGPAGAPCLWEHEDGGREEGRVDAHGTTQAPARPGYWNLSCGARSQHVAVAPARCFGVQDAVKGRSHTWGLVLQPYAARGPHDGGVGDTAACAAWAQRTALAGAHALALGPVHAANGIDATYSPYSPGDRRYLDAIHAAPVDAFGDAALHVLDPHPALREKLAALEDATLIDWPAAAAAKWAWLAAVHAAVSADEAAAGDLQRFVEEGGQALARHVAFSHPRAGVSAPVYRFGQWVVSRGWRRAQDLARSAGMGIGLIADLAVGFDPRGAEAAAAGSARLQGLVLGAPPDAFCAGGQVWGVSSYSPQGLHELGFAPFIALLRAVMRDRGGLRIDHILGWQRLWVVPEGADAGQGAYLRYPLQDLLNLAAIESWRQRCIVIGEDLGVVPPGIRQTLAGRGVLGMDVLAFARDEAGGFLSPGAWRADAVAMTGTHDLPTLVGWRRGLDLGWRYRLGEMDDIALQAQAAERAADVQRLDLALGQPAANETDVRLAALEYVASSPAALALLPVEDALGVAEQVNLPGTVATHPNWRQRLPVSGAGQILEDSMARFDAARRRAEP